MGVGRVLRCMNGWMRICDVLLLLKDVLEEEDRIGVRWETCLGSSLAAVLAVLLSESHSPGGHGANDPAVQVS